jgi:hypothetical protein
MTLCVIPARGGSKGVPRKNLLHVGGKPLIVWTIEQALATPGLDVLVSTDDEEIAEVSRAAGARVPWLRPTTFFLVVINLIWSFQVFDVVYVMTNGGPGYDTTMLVTYAYDEGFGAARNFGYGATVGLVLFVLTLAVTLFQVRVNRKSEDA